MVDVTGVLHWYLDYKKLDRFQGFEPCTDDTLHGSWNLALNSRQLHTKFHPHRQWGAWVIRNWTFTKFRNVSYTPCSGVSLARFLRIFHDQWMILCFNLFDFA